MGIVAGILILILVIGGVMASLRNSPVQTTSLPRTWHTSASYSGTSDKTTSEFQIQGSQFRLQWRYTADYQFPEYAGFGFFVYPTGETARYVDNMGLVTGGSRSDTEYVYVGPGSFYLEVITANLVQWSIAVEDYY